MQDSKHALRVSASSACAIACLLQASAAHGSGPMATLAQITPRTGSSNVVALGYDYGGNGLLVSRDGGETFAMMCATMASQPHIDEDGKPETLHPGSFSNGIVSHDGHILIGDAHGLWTDDGHGCGWHIVPELLGSVVKDLVFDPTDPTVIYGVTGTGGRDNGLFRRNADGSVEHVGPQEPVLFYGLQAVALPDGGVRLYALAFIESVPVFLNDDGSATIAELLDDGGAPMPGLTYRSRFELRHSDDRGETWTSHEIDLSFPGSKKLAAIDPTHPDRVVVVLHLNKDFNQREAEPDIVLVSEDRGATFREWIELSEVGGISIAADGTVWLGEHGEGSNEDSRGLWRADSLLHEPKKLADFEVRCVEAREDRLEVCQRFDWGTADPDTGAFTMAVSFAQIEAIHSCDGLDGAAICQSTFCRVICKHWHEAPACVENYAATVETCGIAQPVAGTGGAGGDGGGGASPVADAGANAMTKSSGCDCHALGGARHAPTGLLVGAALACLLRVRRKRRAVHAGS